MTLPDDSIIDPGQLHTIRKHAEKALKAADAIGRYPTPVSDVMDAARVLVSDEPALEGGFLARLRKRAGVTLKKAVSKVLGLLDVVGRLIYVDRTIYLVKQTFIKLHETAHAVLPWQRDIYCFIEDCDKSLDPDVSDLFDREANTFASEVLFQLDDFAKRFADEPLNILVPVKHSKDYGASIYATIRRYVSTNHRSCVVLVINPPLLVEGEGFIATLRRVIPSDKFRLSFESLTWPDKFTPEDEIGAMIPVGKRRMSGKRHISLRDSNGILHECIAEAFTTTRQVFILIHDIKTLNKTTIYLP